MTGPNRHYIWQMFQRGFLDESTELRQPWIYQRESPPEQDSTKNYGAKDFFYTDDADEALRQFENKHASFVQKARAAPDETTLDSEKSARLVASLELRTKFVRDKMENLGQEAFSSLADGLRNKIRSGADLYSFLEKHADDLSQQDKDLLSESREFISQKNLDVEEIFQLGALSHLVGAIVNAAARNAQSKVLEQDVTETERYMFHLQRRYVVRKVNPHLILPDSYAAFLGKDFTRPFIQDKDYQECIVPINSTSYIHGFKGPSHQRDVNTINKILAGCANRTFIAAAKSIELGQLTSRIGKYSKTYSKKSEYLIPISQLL